MIGNLILSTFLGIGKGKLLQIGLSEKHFASKVSTL